MKAPNRQETEELVIDLYYNKKKTFREIQKIVRKSPRDIRAILNKVEPERSSLSLPSQAYTLFSELKTPIQVAITLNLREADARQLYVEYWNLQGLYDLGGIYREIRENMRFFLELFRHIRSAGFDISHVIELLKVANNDLPTLERRYQRLKGEIASLEAGNRNSARTFQQLSDAITDEYKTLDQYRSFCNKLRQDIDNLLLKKEKIEKFIEYFLCNNDIYLKIKNNVKQEILYTLANPQELLKVALVSLIESSRTEPGKFNALCYNKALATTSSASQSPSTMNYGSQRDYELDMYEGSLRFNHYRSSDEDYERVLLEKSEKLYNKLIDYITIKTVNQATGKIAWLSESEQQSLDAKREPSQGLSTFIYKNEEQTLIQSEMEDGIGKTD